MLEDKFTALKDRLKLLEKKYISSHSDPLELPDDFELDVESYCVLCHAAFEEFIEDVCVYLLDELEDKYKTTGRFSFATLCLLHFDSQQCLLDERWDDNKNIHDYFVERIHKRKDELSTYARMDNHGVGVKYMKKLLIPVGIDLPHDASKLNSLSNLVGMRGGYAHAYSSSRLNRVKRPTNPSEAMSWVGDVLDIMENIYRRARKMSYFKWSY